MTDDLDGPVLDGADRAPEDTRIRGILAQVRGDAASYDQHDIEQLLRDRLHDAGIAVDEERLQHLLAETDAPATNDSAPGIQEERPQE